MQAAFDYAKNQILGMQFENFTMTRFSGYYVWDNHTAAIVCRFLIWLGLESWAKAVFTRYLKVY